MAKEFWKDWKKKTKLEGAAIKSLKTAKTLILKNIPKNEIITIYAKGSFIRREMNKNSDVDTSTIVKNSNSLKILKKLQKNYRNKYKPNIDFTGYSLWELKTNKKSKVGKSDRPAPSRAVQHFEHYEPIYGKKLNKEDFYQGDDKKRLKSMVKTFHTLFLPMYKEKKLGFSGIVKQTFWLVENEQKALGKNPPHSFKKMAKFIKEDNHIINDIIKFRKKLSKDKKERSKFITKLKKYLSKLEKVIK